MHVLRKKAGVLATYWRVLVLNPVYICDYLTGSSSVCSSPGRFLSFAVICLAPSLHLVTIL